MVDERALAVDLDYREPLAVEPLELVHAGDVDFLERERHLLAHAREDGARSVAERAALGVVERDPALYGYSPRVVVASATRRTASPYAAMRIVIPRASRVSHVSSNARVVISFRRAFTSSSFQKYS